METDPSTLLTGGHGHWGKGLMHACGFPSLWSSLLAPETGEVGRNRAASAGWGPGGTVSLSLLHLLRLTCMRGE